MRKIFARPLGVIFQEVSVKLYESLDLFRNSLMPVVAKKGQLGKGDRFLSPSFD